jgi:subtilase family serine protease
MMGQLSMPVRRQPAVSALALGLAVPGVLAIALAVSGAAGPAARGAPGGRLARNGFELTRADNGPGGGLDPSQIRAAYNLGPLLRRGVNGAGQTIVIVDSFGSPTIRHDLKHFDARFGLSAPRSLRIIQPAGKVPPFRPTDNRLGWAAETTLDVEWAHVMAPAARIVLVETPTSENEGTSGFPQIVTAETYVIRHHLGGVISQSFGATEQTFPSRSALLRLRSAYILAARPASDVTVLAATGDEGAAGLKPDGHSYYLTRAIGWPASDPLVTAVGGIQLNLTAAGRRRSPDVAWDDGGGGRSVIFARPAYQDRRRNRTGRHRGIPDISMDASCDSAVDVYQSFPGGAGWGASCGTSLATPLFAGIVALADQVAHHRLGPINKVLYQMAAAKGSGIVDIVSGNNSFSFFQDGKDHTVSGLSASRGYDLASGLGTVDAARFVPRLAAAARPRHGWPRGQQPGAPARLAPARLDPALLAPALRAWIQRLPG